MNPPVSRPPSRFIRGRGRGGSGGGAYRPYFYFKRNGQTIPAGGGGFARNFNTGRGQRGRKTTASSGTLPPLPDTPFLRSENYVAPENALLVQSIIIDSPLQCPGWRLYFPTDDYEQSPELLKRIKALETHYIKNIIHYDFTEIQSKSSFVLQAKVITSDEAVMTEWPTLLQDVQEHTYRTLATFGVAMHSVVTAVAIDAVHEQDCTRNFYAVRNTRVRKIYVRTVGFVSIDTISHITNNKVDSLYCVRGTILSVGAVDVFSTWIAFKCARCKQEQAVRQTKTQQNRQPFACKRDNCLAKKGFIEQRSSQHTCLVPAQVIRLAEYQPHKINDNDVEIPEYIDIELSHELVDSVTIGQDIIVTGILKMRPLCDEDAFYNASRSNALQIYLKAVSILSSVQNINATLSERDLEAITMINGEPDSFKLLVNSMAPEVHGQEIVKAGVLLSLFGGAGSQLHDEKEINVLLVGDPGIGKTHMLQMCAKISERGFLHSSKRSSSTSNRLTVAVEGRNNYTINAGALLTAINGHCAIDDIDSLASQQDILLQTIQSQNISVASPSVHFAFNTPTSVVATANPTRGNYDQSKLLTENIRISPALLREFHLVFVLMDKPNKDLDTSLTEHIKSLHAGEKKSTTIAARFDMKPKTNYSMNISLRDEEYDSKTENYDLSIRLRLNAADEDELDLLPTILIKKFIIYARQQVKPLLNAEAAKAIKNFYMELRNEKNDENSVAISTSQLGGLIRLTQARARIDFSSEVTVLHVRDVLAIVRHSIADTSVGDYIDTNPATAAGMSKLSMVKRFIQMLHMRSGALARRIFDFDELKDMATHAGISCGVTDIVDYVNLQGILLKKGPNLYEIVED